MTTTIEGEIRLYCNNVPKQSEFRDFLGTDGLRRELLQELDFFVWKADAELPDFSNNANLRASIIIPTEDPARVFRITAYNLSELYKIPIEDCFQITYDIYCSLCDKRDFVFQDVVDLIKCHKYIVNAK